MRLSLLLLACSLASVAVAHPHSGGLVVLPGGTVLAGDVIGSRVLVIAPDGSWRAIENVGHIRGLARSSEGTIYGVSWGPGGGVWRLDSDYHRDRVTDSAGRDALIAAGPDAGLLFAPVDAMGIATRVDAWRPPDMPVRLVSISDFTAFAHHRGGTVLAVDDRLVFAVGDQTREMANGLAGGIHGLTSSPRGVIAAVFGTREVVEIGDAGRRRVLLTAEPPWAPTDVAFVDGTLYVLELAQHDCCWKGPRIRRMAADGSVTTLLDLDPGPHVHAWPSDRPMHWLVGTLGLALAGLLAVRRRRRGPAAPTPPG